MRPLFLEFPHDDESFSVADQYMVGNELLVAPVLERGARKRMVYLPPEKGGDRSYWKEWWSDQKLKDGYHLVDSPLDVMPIFLREGQGVPVTEALQSTEKCPDELTLRCSFSDKRGKT